MSDCVLWHRTDVHGYPVRYVRGTGYGKKDHKRVAKAHRVAYEEVHGPIPEGMHVHHLCHTKACVNVEHMQLMTNRDHQSALGHGKLLERDAAAIRQLKREGWHVDDIAGSFGVSKWTVYDIAKGRTWATGRA